MTDPVESRKKLPEETELEIVYKNLNEQSFVGIYIVQDGIFQYANPRMAEIFGYEPDEFIGKLGPEHVIHREDWPAIRARSRKRLTGEIERDYYQFRGVKKDKSVIYLEVYGSVIVYRGKRAITGAVSDISERVRAQEALRESELKYRNLSEQSFVGVYIVQDGIFQYANSRMAEIFGTSQNEFVGKLGPEHVIHSEDWPAVRERSRKRLNGEIERDYYQFRGIKKDNSIIYVEIYGWRDDFRGKKAVIGVANDITDRIIAQESLKRELDRRKDFMLVAAHELRTPLQPLYAYFDLILSDPGHYGLNDEGIKIITQMKWSTDHEVKIVNRMLELSLIQSGMDKTEPAFRKFSPRHVIDLILKSKKYYNEAEIALRIPPEISIVSDMDYCHEIFAEILSNAVQYSNPPRKIEITYNESTDAVCFSFRDNGIGLSQEDINNIFHPFYIADAPKLSRKYGRMGLGLSLAKERVATLGGEIRVNSEIGHGSTFTIQLPKVEIKVR